MNLFENLQKMNENSEVKTFNISFKRNDVYQANLIKGYSEEQVVEYFKSYKPDAEVLGVKVATNDDMRPGKPVIDATVELKNNLEESQILKDDKDIEEVVEASILKDEKDVEAVVEQKIIKDEKDIEQIVEGTQPLTEDSDNILDLVEAKAKRFGAMVDAIAEDMPTSEVNDFLSGLTGELDMDIYEGDKPYPTDLAGYFGQPVDELDLNDSDDLEMINWINEILTKCIDDTTVFIKSKIETLRGELSAIEGDITRLESII